MAFLAGSASVIALPELPDSRVVLACLLIAPLLILWSRVRGVGWGLLGAALCVLHAQCYLDARLRADEAGEYRIVVAVVGLPSHDEQSTRFEARVLDAGTAPARLLGERIRFVRYDNAWNTMPGDVWAVRARLRAPRGLANPGGFDAERYAAQRGLVATGIVTRAEPAEHPVAWSMALQQRLDRMRVGVARRFDESGVPTARFLRGLSVGDTTGLDDRDWETLRATGLSHLLAISGLHVGLIAGLAAWLVRGIYRVVPALATRIPLVQGAALGAWLAGSAYAVLAGLGLPTLRALLMLALVCLLAALRRRMRATHVLLLAAFCLVALDPLAMLGAGFWLSFLGVAWLVLCLPVAGSEAPRRWFLQLVRAQGVLLLGLFPLTVSFFGQASLVGPVLNLVAVPWVSLATVPLALAATVLQGTGWLGQSVLWAADRSMAALWQVAERAAALDHAELFLPEPGVVTLLVVLVGVAWLLAPRGTPGKPMAVLLLVPLLWPADDAPAPGAFRLRVLDVGQGTAVLVQTHGFQLLYDAGAAFRSGGDMGDQVVVPAMRGLGLRSLDVMVISHADGDHAGGARSVWRAFRPGRVVSGEPRSLRDDFDVPSEHCSGVQPLTVDGVRIEMLHPPEHFPELGNDSSCVLRISNGRHSALLVGDIGEVVEQRLLRESGDLDSDLLLVAHHGSRSSSSRRFIDAVRPTVAVVSAGFQNRFGHPHPDVVARLRDSGARVMLTAETGMLSWQTAVDATPALQSWRDTRRRWWRAD